MYGGRNVVVPSVLDGSPQELGGDAGGDDAGGLALVVRGSDRRVALDVLDRAQAGADRPRDVGDGRVALQVDELDGAGGAVDVGHPPHHRGRRALGRLRHARQVDVTAPVDAEAIRGRRRRPMAVGEAAREVEHPGRRPRDRRRGQWLGREERPERGVVAQLSARLAEQVDRGVPAAAHQEQIALDAVRPAGHPVDEGGTRAAVTRARRPRSP